MDIVRYEPGVLPRITLRIVIVLVDGAEGRKSMELITAVYESCVTGREVALPITEADPFYTAEGRTAALPHFHEKTRSTARSGSGKALFA